MWVVSLRVESGPSEGREFAFEEHDTFLVGRSSACNIRLSSKDRQASRHHFLLEVSPPLVRVRDLGSGNGTYVNGERIGRRQKHEEAGDTAQHPLPQIDLTDGDTIRAGETVLVVEVRARCSECGSDFATGADTVTLDASGLRCRACRERADREGTIIVESCSRRACRVCGSDLTSDLGDPTRTSDEECERCRSATGDSADGVRPRVERALGDRYKLGPELGRGGMGVVYQAVRQTDRRELALKAILPSIAVTERARKRFQREVEALRRIEHPNCVGMLDHGSSGSLLFLALELCRGGDLERFVSRNGGKLDIARAAPLMLQALDGVASIHERGHVHRDIKPSNLLLSADGASGELKVGDFGLAKCLDSAGLTGLTVTKGGGAGTPAFMAKEQLVNFKGVKPASDVWSLGATFYHMLTGEHPRRPPSGASDPILAVLAGTLVPIREREPLVPEAVGTVIDQALAPKPENRPRDAGELRAVLRRALGD